ncbi:glucosamine-6-phosphate isomerase/6-phosphogluconolactonase [Aureococcus anophagefferens]|nr:glucosamine-6-phosphate isomerase/6-phosphogluconolactonase [Aureococcus anophagefferens]
MRLLTFENKDKVGMHVAEHVVRRINEFQPTKERPFVIGKRCARAPACTLLVYIDPANVHILDGNAPDLEAECAAYEASIEKFGGIELFLAGIGPDGHIALSGAYDTIVANSRFFDNDLSKVPTKALTVGVATVMDAKEVLIIITGISKSLALRNCIEEPLSHMWTASAIQLHDKGVIVCDEDATMELRVKTVRYFDKLQKSPQGLYGDLGVGVVP